MIGVDEVGRHVQASSWKVDEGGQLVAGVAAVAEPLEADDQDGGDGPEVELLGGLLVLLALRTVPEDKISKLGLEKNCLSIVLELKYDLAFYK